MEALCNECRQETDVKFKTRKFGDGLVETFFKCRNCHVKYVAFITDKKVRRLQKETNKLRNDPNKSVNDLAVINTNQEFINVKMDELKDRYAD